MTSASATAIRSQLLDRRDRLQRSLSEAGQAADLVQLLQAVDEALGRLDGGAFGRCEMCGEGVDEPDLLANPLSPWCLCALNPAQLAALQRDLDLARRIQLSLLPRQDLTHAGWEVHFRYQPHGPVSGDYCDVVTRERDGDSLLFALGDVSGKGVAASLLMARLNALLRGLVRDDPPMNELVARADRLFSENNVATHYATLVCGRATKSGLVELCNAGHCPPLLVRGGEVSTLAATGFPVGLFAGTPYELHRVDLAPGDTLLLYTDGLTEAPDGDGRLYGAERLGRLLASQHSLRPGRLAAACLADVADFASGAPRSDDLTLMVVRRAGPTTN